MLYVVTMLLMQILTTCIYKMWRIIKMWGELVLYAISLLHGLNVLWLVILGVNRTLWQTCLHTNWYHVPLFARQWVRASFWYELNLTIVTIFSKLCFCVYSSMCSRETTLQLGYKGCLLTDEFTLICPADYIL